MKGIEKAAIYPYNIEFAPVLRHGNLLDKVEIISVIAPKGFGMSGCDAGIADNGSNLGIIVKDNFNEEIKKCDTVIFCDVSDIQFDFDTVIKEKMLFAIEAGKNIICTVELKEDLRTEMSEKCKKAGTYFKYLSSKGQLLYDNSMIVSQAKKKIETPVIFIMGVSNNTNKFELQLSLRDKLLKNNYKVCQVGTRSYCELFGFHSFPEFMLSRSFHEHEKILLFNWFIRELEVREKPDVIVIGLPGGIIPINSQFTNKFGVFAFEISNAITPDAVIFSTLYEEFQQDYLEFIETRVSNKFGYEVDCFNISNRKFEWNDAQEEKEMIFSTLDYQFVNKKRDKFKDYKTPVFNVLDQEDKSKIPEFIIDKLIGYEYAEKTI